MAFIFNNDNYIYNIDEFPSREELLNITEDIKVTYYLHYIKKKMLMSIIDNQKQCILFFSEFNIEQWTLNKVIKILKTKGYWITEDNEKITILW